MKSPLLALCTLFLASGTALYAQDSDAALVTHLANGASIVTPRSAIVRPEDEGTIVRANVKNYVPAGRPEGVTGFTQKEFEAAVAQPILGSMAETPATLACIYGIVPVTLGCPTNGVTAVASGGSKAIALVLPYDYPTAFADLKAFAKYWGLPTPTAANFTVTWKGTKPTPDPTCAIYGGNSCWAATSAMAIEMAYSMAPKAHIYLVEAPSASYTDMYGAVSKAVAVVTAAGGGEITMGWGIPEISEETYGDTLLNIPKIVFFSSIADGGRAQYPAASPNVVAVGGTSISRNPATLDFQTELTWQIATGGMSAYESRPTFQDGIKATVGTSRGVPDVAALANPETGVWIYDSYDNTYGGVTYPWTIFGGTAVAADLWAGIANNAGSFSANSAAELALIYGNSKSPGSYWDVTDGGCGPYYGHLATTGWDFCTGNGAPFEKGAK